MPLKFPFELRRGTALDLAQFLSRLSHMIRFACSCLVLISLWLTGCDNRTQEARRWETIAKDLKSGNKVQPWREAADPWSNQEHHSGVAW